MDHRQLGRLKNKDISMQQSFVITTLRYRDAPAAIDWLVSVLSFEKHLVVPDANGGIAHAELTLGNGMIMLSSVSDTPFNKLMKQPDEIGGAETQSCYLVVDDADAVHERVIAANAKVVIAIKDEDYGGRGFSCLDPEGHLWNVGSYDPWVTG
jgi:uncharacterized glyoxalase superfamily protein PhnB